MIIRISSKFLLPPPSSLFSPPPSLLSSTFLSPHTKSQINFPFNPNPNEFNPNQNNFNNPNYNFSKNQRNPFNMTTKFSNEGKGDNKNNRSAKYHFKKVSSKPVIIFIFI